MKVKRQFGVMSANKVANPNAGAWVHTNDIGYKKGPKQEAHTCPAKHGMGDYHGTGVKNPMGRMRSDSVGIRPVDRKQFKAPPRNLA